MSYEQTPSRPVTLRDIGVQILVFLPNDATAWATIIDVHGPHEVSARLDRIIANPNAASSIKRRHTVRVCRSDTKYGERWLPIPSSAGDLAVADAAAFGTGLTQTNAEGIVRHVPNDAWTKALNDIQSLTYERTRAADALAEVQRVLKISGSGDDGLSSKRVAELLNRIGPVLDDVNERQRLRDNPPIVYDPRVAVGSPVARNG